MKKLIILGLTFIFFNTMAFSQDNNIKLNGTIWIRNTISIPNNWAEYDYIEFVNQTTFMMSNGYGKEVISGKYRINGNEIYLTDLVWKRTLYEGGRLFNKTTDKWLFKGNILYNSFGDAFNLGNESTIIKVRPMRNAIVVSDKPTTPDILQGVISEYIKEADHDFSVVNMQTSSDTIGVMIIEIISNGKDLDYAEPVNGNNKPHRLAWQVVDMFAKQKSLNLDGNRKFVNYITYEKNNYILIRIY